MMTKSTDKPAVETTRDLHPMDSHYEDNIKPGDIAAEEIDRGQGISGCEALTVGQTIKLFKFATFVCVVAPFTAGTEEY
ncbi:MFS alpha-glucoside transporter [Colletotrichum truncatum]|uniref:MFS alpha-glucoside transporter n=1 Tax=Colletotrichum truncatum TaxID=5467 RepID=A0ACC3YSU1_COLTU